MQEIITIRPETISDTKQQLPNFVGVSEKNTGAKGLSMNKVIIPPGAEAKAHYHDGFETAIYLLQGEVETLYGEKLEKSVINKPGDFVFIPPGLPHLARNLSQTEPAIGIVARNDPNEQESVVMWEV